VPLDGAAAAASRTYTIGGSGTAGQFIPAVAAVGALTGEARLPWLIEVGGAEPWRTNLGLLNPDPRTPCRSTSNSSTGTRFPSDSSM